jgi:HK97 gp10 family phage protein
MANDLDRYLAKLPEAVARKLATAIRDEASALSEAQRERLASLQQDPEETGNLEASCIATDGANELEAIVQAGGDTTTVDGFDHALAFEFGTTHQPARPFFFSTYEERRPQMEANLQKAMKEAFDE